MPPVSDAEPERSVAGNAGVILIDGDRLARLVIQYGVGVQTRRTHRLVEMDEDFSE
jgi:restriction system protein